VEETERPPALSNEQPAALLFLAAIARARSQAARTIDALARSGPQELDVPAAEAQVRRAQEMLRQALTEASRAHRRAALAAERDGDALSAHRHMLLAREDALSARCLPSRDLDADWVHDGLVLAPEDAS
jgi:hypothetical protein